MINLFRKKLDPDQACVEARALVARGLLTQALELHEKVLLEKPDFALAYADRGTVFAMTKQYAKAVTDLQSAWDLGYREGSLLATLATVQTALGELEAAVETFGRAEQISPGNALIFYNRAALHISLGNRVSAASDLNRCLEMRPDAAFKAAIIKRMAEIPT